MFICLDCEDYFEEPKIYETVTKVPYGDTWVDMHSDEAHVCPLCDGENYTETTEDKENELHDKALSYSYRAIKDFNKNYGYFDPNSPLIDDVRKAVRYAYVRAYLAGYRADRNV